MSLQPYRSKRRFAATPEPRGGKPADGGPLRFVVQEHHARRHHYDFRLELDGTLKSWAVPKGPSQDPREKRLAVRTEDHPLEYLSFAGKIPEGNYGAGTVTIWDSGTYHARESADRQKSDAALRQGLQAGKITIILHGQKLQGEYALVKMRGREENAWLLTKSLDPDQKANPRAIDPASVRVQVDGQVVTLTNLAKVYWPDEGYTKGDLLAYYQNVAPVILPHLRDRPQSLNRHPDGIDGASFYQKDMTRQPPPDWARTLVVDSSSERKEIRYLLCQDAPSLLYLVNLGCIEINPWLSHAGTLDRPDFAVIDLDPEDIGFDAVIQAAQAVHKTLDRIGAPSYCKTSGKSGIHIYVPLAARYDYDQSKLFAQLIAGLVHQQLPQTTSVRRLPAQRQQRVYLDFLQNRRGQTLAAPYSVRPVPGALVSTPLNWSELRKGLDFTRHTIHTTQKRLDKLGDLWEPLLKDQTDLLACLERLARVMAR